MTSIYKLVDEAAWRAAEQTGMFAGAPVDLADGYIHFSAADQLAETAARHFAGVPGLLLVAVDAARFGEALRWEPSRGGALFPHLYAPLPVAAAHAVLPLQRNADGLLIFPEPLP